MYGFWRLGFRPRPSAGATCVANGLETNTSTKAKNTITVASTGTTQTVRSRDARRFSTTAAALYAVRSRSQKRSEPDWPPQRAASA